MVMTATMRYSVVDDHSSSKQLVCTPHRST
jgi:hypothetical protein